MKICFVAPLGLLAALSVATAAPTITAGGIYNAASYAYTGLPNAAIAQGSLFVVFGSGLGPSPLQSSGLPLSSTLGGTSLTATVNGTSTKPLLVYTSAGQIGAVLPSNTPVGTGTLTVTYNGQTSATSTLQVSPGSFGIFSVNQAGSGPGIITNASYAVAGLTASANPGQVYIVWGTGLGPAISGDESNGSATLGTINVQVLVGGAAAPVSGYARSSCCGGVDQIAFTVPTGVVGCHVPVAVQVGNTVSNFVSMPIAATGSVCTDPANTNTTTLGNQPTVSVGSISLSRSTLSFALPAPLPSSTSTFDSGSASFEKFTAAQYASEVNPLQITTFGACTVFTFTGASASFTDPVQAAILDAGPSLSVTGPNGTQTLTKTSGVYSATLGGGIAGIPGSPVTPLYLSQGQYTVNNGNGGADVGPFTATLNLPAPIVWTNAASLTTVNRSQAQTVTWTGGNSSSSVLIIGSALINLSSTAVGAEFVCTAPASAGSFTIPTPVLLSLPATTGGLASSSGQLGLALETTNTFTAKGLDQAAISGGSFTLQSVTFQ